LKDIAEGMPDGEIPFAFGGEKGAKRRAHARHYMEKLINLEVTIPQMDGEAAAALIHGTSPDKLNLTDQDRRWLKNLKPTIEMSMRSAGLVMRLLLIAVIAGYFWNYGGELYQKITTVPVKEVETVKVVPDKVSKTSIDEEFVETTHVSIEESVENSVPLAEPEIPPTPISAHWNRQELWVLVPVLALLMTLIGWQFLRRAYQINKDIEYDPDTFVKALGEANRVIESVNSTPRAVKRFMNRIRFASARMRTIHYQTGILDWLAIRMGWVSEGFEDKAEGMPRINDPKVIALGTMEALIQDLPDPELGIPDLYVIIDHFVEERSDRTGAQEIGENIKNILRNSGVTLDDYSNYFQTMGSSSLDNIGLDDGKADQPLEPEIKAVVN